MRGALAPTGEIWTALIRYGQAGHVGRFGVVRHLGVGRGTIVVVQTIAGPLLGETLSEWMCQTAPSGGPISSRPLEHSSHESVAGEPLTGECLRIATSDDHADAVHARVIATEILADVGQQLERENLPLVALEAETSLDGRITTVVCLGEADERVGRLAVHLSRDGRFVRFLFEEPISHAVPTIQAEFVATSDEADAGHDDSAVMARPTDETLSSAAPPRSLTSRERIKRASDGLRGTLRDELADPSDRVSKDAAFLLQHHGVYQQKHHDRSRPYTPSGGSPFEFMLRVAPPGGRLLGSQWRVLVQIARQQGGSLRLTSRQSVQIHGLAKRAVLESLARLTDRWMTTFAACGDTVRNIVVCPRPTGSPTVRKRLAELAVSLARLFAPQSNAYIELIVAGERNAGSHSDDPTVSSPHRSSVGDAESLLGPAYLPRKLKIALTAGCNCLDLRTHDIGLAAIVEAGRIKGWRVFVGGGLAFSPDRPETFPALGTAIGIVSDADVMPLVQAIVVWHRDQSDRTDRRQARLRYTIARRTWPTFLTEIQQLASGNLRLLPDEETPPLPPARDHLGLFARLDGRYDVGLVVPWGRLSDTDAMQWLTALERITTQPCDHLTVTPRQNLLLEGVSSETIEAMRQILDETNWPAPFPAVTDGNGLTTPAEMSAQSLPVLRDAMACVAFPTCGLALAEAERVADDVLPPLLKALGVEPNVAAESVPRCAVAGCGNGCSRPLTADLGLIGRGPNRYDLVIGGTGDRLARRLMTNHTPAELALELTRLVDSLQSPVVMTEAGRSAQTLAWPTIIERLYAQAERGAKSKPFKRFRRRPTSLDV